MLQLLLRFLWQILLCQDSLMTVDSPSTSAPSPACAVLTENIDVHFVRMILDSYLQLMIVDCRPSASGYPLGQYPMECPCSLRQKNWRRLLSCLHYFCVCVKCLRLSSSILFRFSWTSIFAYVFQLTVLILILTSLCLDPQNSVHVLSNSVSVFQTVTLVTFWRFTLFMMILLQDRLWFFWCDCCKLQLPSFPQISFFLTVIFFLSCCYLNVHVCLSSSWLITFVTSLQQILQYLDSIILLFVWRSCLLQLPFFQELLYTLRSCPSRSSTDDESYDVFLSDTYSVWCSIICPWNRSNVIDIGIVHFRHSFRTHTLIVMQSSQIHSLLPLWTKTFVNNSSTRTFPTTLPLYFCVTNPSDPMQRKIPAKWTDKST